MVKLTVRSCDGRPGSAGAGPSNPSVRGQWRRARQCLGHSGDEEQCRRSPPPRCRRSATGARLRRPVEQLCKDRHEVVIVTEEEGLCHAGNQLTFLGPLHRNVRRSPLSRRGRDSVREPVGQLLRITEAPTQVSNSGPRQPVPLQRVDEQRRVGCGAPVDLGEQPPHPRGRLLEQRDG